MIPNDKESLKFWLNMSILQAGEIQKVIDLSDSLEDRLRYYLQRLGKQKQLCRNYIKTLINRCKWEAKIPWIDATWVPVDNLVVWCWAWLARVKKGNKTESILEDLLWHMLRHTQISICEMKVSHTPCNQSITCKEIQIKIRNICYIFVFMGQSL